jgi:predicted RNase H-like nuclease (RuvC/YqgF family)
MSLLDWARHRKSNSSKRADNAELFKHIAQWCQLWALESRQKRADVERLVDEFRRDKR